MSVQSNSLYFIFVYFVVMLNLSVLMRKDNYISGEDLKKAVLPFLRSTNVKTSVCMESKLVFV